MYFRYYLGLAKQATIKSVTPMPSYLKWAFTYSGHRFLVSKNFEYGSSSTEGLFSSIGNLVDPLTYVIWVSFIQYFDIERNA